MYRSANGPALDAAVVDEVLATVEAYLRRLLGGEAEDTGDGVNADQRDRLERVTRSALRPPVSQERLEWTADGQVWIELRRLWSDGTTHLLFDPVELLERLAALVPRPRINLILYHGVLAPRAAWRARVVEYGRARGRRACV